MSMSTTMDVNTSASTLRDLAGETQAQISASTLGELYSSSLAELKGQTLAAKVDLARITVREVGLDPSQVDNPNELVSATHEREELAKSMIDAGELDGACELYHEVMVVQVRQLGPRHVDVLKTKTTLAELVAQQSNLTGAKVLLEEVRPT